MKKKNWKLLGTESIFKNKYVTLDSWRMRQPRGGEAEYFIHRTYDFVVVCAFTKNKNVLLLNQYYVSQGKHIATLVAGIIDGDEQPKTSARRELLEETGYQAGRIVPLGSVIKGKYATGKAYYFLALDAEKVAEQHLEAGEDIEVKPTPFSRFKQMVEGGKIPEVHMELCARRALSYLKKHGV